jgi:hypothetical protein
MRRSTWIGILIALALAPGAGWCGGVYGPSGLFLHPTGYLPPDRHTTLGATYFTQRSETAAGKRTTEWVPVFADQRLSRRFEGGLVYLHQRAGSQDKTSYGGFAKYQLLAEEGGRPAVGLAVDYLSGDLRSASGYLVASKQFELGRHPLRAHLGYMVTRRSDLQGAAGRFHETDDAPYAGLELFLTPKLRLVGEVEAKMKFYAQAPMSVGLMWNPSRNTGLGIGWLNTGRSTDSRFFVGVGYKIKSVD